MATLPAVAGPKLSHVGVLLLGQCLVLTLLALGGDARSAVVGLVWACVAGAAGIVVVWGGSLRPTLGTTALVILLAAYFTRIAVGVVHYLWMLDPHYFSDPASYDYLYDYKWMHDTMCFVSSYWHENGFLSELPSWYYEENKNRYLHIYNALLYYFTGEKALNVAPWNALHQIYTATLVAALALGAGATRRQAVFALTLAAFQPFGFVSSMMWRDSVGQAWVILAVYMLVSLRDKVWLGVAALPAACFLAYSQREPYLLVVAIGACLMWLFTRKAGVGQKFALIVAGALGVVLTSALTYVWDISTMRTIDQISAEKFSYFPLRLLRAVMGPFPWLQVTAKPDGYEYLPVDYAQAVFNLTVLLVVVPTIVSRFRRTGTVDPSVFFGSLFCLSGMIASGVHIGYVSIGMVLFLPQACMATRSWWKPLVLTLTFFAIANVLYVALGFWGSGIIMKQTGY